MRWQDLSLAFVLACTASQSQAQPAWKPDRNVEIVVPSAPGGSNDKTARTVERIIQEKRLLAGTTLTVVNKPGGGNMMTMNYLIQHPGDAHYVMVGTPTILTTKASADEARKILTTEAMISPTRPTMRKLPKAVRSFLVV